MATSAPHEKVHHMGVPVYPNDVEQQQCKEGKESNFDYSQRGQWLRAAILGANDGLVSTASVMMGVGAVKRDIKAMLLAGFAGLVAGACSMVIGEFVSVYTQLEIEMTHSNEGVSEQDTSKEKEKLPNPFQASVASAFSFSVGGLVPLIGAAFIKEYKVMIGVVVAVSSLALVVFGAVGAILGRTPMPKSCVRMLFGGLMAMAITYGLTKLIAYSGVKM